MKKLRLLWHLLWSDKYVVYTPTTFSHTMHPMELSNAAMVIEKEMIDLTIELVNGREADDAVKWARRIVGQAPKP